MVAETGLKNKFKEAFMPNINARAAFVSRAASSFPVYTSQVPGSGWAGNVTAGGAQKGSINPNEMFTVIMNDLNSSGAEIINWNITCFKIAFRNPSGALDFGWIETSQGTGNPSYSWANSLYAYHTYKSNGSNLAAHTSSQKVTIGNYTYNIFDVVKPVAYKNQSGGNMGTIPAGYQLATNQSTIGQSNPQFMLFAKVRSSSSGAWTDLANGTYGFVDLGFGLGSSPSARAIR
jgi:hypothetical protein